MEAWGPARADDLTALFGLALPNESLTTDELVACSWDDPTGAVLGDVDGSAAVALVTRPVGDDLHAFIVALGVAPVVQGDGRGRRLLDAAVAWAGDHGCRALHAGGSAPFYLWPGVDTRWTRAICLFESAGFARLGAEVNMSCPSTYRSPAPAGTEVERVVADADAERVRDFCTEHFAHWVPEVDRGIEQGACFLARASGEEGAVLGFACHSVSRAGWLGPMGTDPARRHERIGAALLGAVCADVAESGRPDVEIVWVGPVGFYAKSAGAAVSRVFLRMSSRIGR
ncbi:MAG: GNAT family N-acetyltransferase [Actinobacteria bacterium]|nr:GNAT family N-acetyltransferase [Actinomycetota bacterium]MBV8957223.1 GNAT family N-acetyltransferase [Actinomycetota bacterium]MBV9255271.1 GNAT family N-acetyltransferase [Actinomycetota bacterium]MBV9664663.1 GNAT family N-acetyltransferase [Actinomycetota bacterium]MBV9933848.1 GNAT family N-acetyltransferase [Actinomycetota bacterium]